MNSPAVVVASQTTLPVGIFHGVVRVLEGLVPEQAGFSTLQAGLVLESPVVLPVSGVTLWKDKRDGGSQLTAVCHTELSTN